MKRKDILYTCIGCGVCCKGRLVPLTVEEAKQWLHRGHDVAIILEAFNELTWPETSPQYAHAAGRSVEVSSGAAKIQVIAIFAGNALTQCPNLRDDNLCGIYEERPLVCRIYPMEINPFIELQESKKICPPESWQSGEILCTDGVANPALQAMIVKSRQADVFDATVKIAACNKLGLSVAAWKNDAIVVYFPERSSLLEAINAATRAPRESLDSDWKIHTEKAELREQLLANKICLAEEHSLDYIHHSLI